LSEKVEGDDMKEKAVVDNFSKGIVIPELE